MSQKSEMKKKKKELKEKQNKELFSLKVTVMESEDIKVEGPINDPVLFMRILASALNTVADHTSRTNQNISEAVEAKKEEARVDHESRQEKETPVILGPDGQEASETPKIEVVH